MPVQTVRGTAGPTLPSTSEVVSPSEVGWGWVLVLPPDVADGLDALLDRRVGREQSLQGRPLAAEDAERRDVVVEFGVAAGAGRGDFLESARHRVAADVAAGCVGVVEYQADSPAHELLDGHDRGVRVTESEALDEAIESAWTEPHRDLAEPLRDYDHAAVAGSRSSELSRPTTPNIDFRE